MDVQKHIEFLLQNQANHDVQIAKNAEQLSALVASQRELVQSQRKNETLLTQVIESIDSLARIAHAHEQRITGLEGGPA